jgi:hypothetical protein
MLQSIAMAPESENLPASVAALIEESVTLERRGDYAAALQRATHQRSTR